MRSVNDDYNFNPYIIRIPGKELDIAVSVKETDIPRDGINVYPNPATDLIYFRLTPRDLQEGIHIEFHPLTGKTVLSRPIQGQGNTLKMDISNLPP